MTLLSKLPAPAITLIKSIMVLNYFVPQTLLDAIDMQEMADFIGGQSENENEELAYWRTFTYLFALGLGACSAALLAYVIWINIGKQTVSAEDIQSITTEPSDMETGHTGSIKEISSSHVEHDHHHGGLGHLAMDTLIIGGPFGLIAAAGTLEFMEIFKLNTSLASKILIPTLAGVFNAIGTTYIHSRHVHEDGGFLANLKTTFIDAFKDKTALEKLRQGYWKSGIVIGHALEGVFAASLIVEKTGLNNLAPAWINWMFKIALGTAVMLVESNSECRSMDKLRAQETVVERKLPKALPYGVGGIHALPNSIPLAQFIDYLLTSDQGHLLANALPLESGASSATARMIIFAFAYALLGIPNARGFAALIREATQKNENEQSLVSANGMFARKKNLQTTDQTQTDNLNGYGKNHTSINK